METRKVYNTAEVLLYIRQKREWTQGQLAEALGVTEGYVSLLEARKRFPSNKMALRIRDLWFEVYDGSDIDISIGNGQSSNEIRPIVTHGTATIPYYRHYIHAGTKGAHVLEDDVEQFNINEHYANTAAYEVAGDSMIDADIREGDRVIVRLGYRFKQDDIILCRYNGELMVKGARVVDNVIWLIPMNEKYHAWECKETDQLEVIGVVVEVIRKPDVGAVKRKSIPS